MSFMFSKPKLPEISNVPPPVIQATTPPPPTKEEDIVKVKEEEKKKLRKGREKRSTILTSERGVLAPAQVRYKTLLGE